MEKSKGDLKLSGVPGLGITSAAGFWDVTRFPFFKGKEAFSETDKMLRRLINHHYQGKYLNLKFHKEATDHYIPALTAGSLVSKGSLSFELVSI